MILACHTGGRVAAAAPGLRTRARLTVGSAVWACVATLVVLSARVLVYALAPAPTVVGARLEYATGGPRPLILALVVIAIAVALSTALVSLVALGVSERQRLEPRAAAPHPISGRRLVRNGTLLWLVCMTGFTLLESVLHWRAGLGWHGIHCLTGPVHRDAIPILAALSLVASAVLAALSHLLGWMRRTLAALAPAGTRFGRAVSCRFPRHHAVCRPLLQSAAFGARGPPV